MYSFEQLKVFITVSETGSFSAAARKLKRAQSGVSQSIANLEISINQVLFNREKNTPTLTENGKVLLPIAKSILHQQMYLDKKLKYSTNEYELIIAIDESLMSNDLLNIFTQLSDKYPLTRVDIVSTSTREVEELVRTGRAQLGIAYADSELKADIEFFLFGQVRFLTISTPEHPLAQFNSVQYADLKRYSQCVYQSKKHKEQLFSSAISTRIWNANTYQILIGLVRKNIGWANVPEQLVTQYLEEGSLISLPVGHDHNRWIIPVGYLISKAHPLGPVLTSLKENLQKYHFTY